MLCEHDLMHGISLPVVANPHLTNPSLRDWNIVGKRNEEQWRGTVSRGNTHLSLNNNCQGPLEKKFITKYSFWVSWQTFQY